MRMISTQELIDFNGLQFLNTPSVFSFMTTDVNSNTASRTLMNRCFLVCACTLWPTRFTKEGRSFRDLFYNFCSDSAFAAFLLLLLYCFCCFSAFVAFLFLLLFCFLCFCFSALCFCCFSALAAVLLSLLVFAFKPLDLVCCWGGALCPPQPPARHEICTLIHLRHPRLPRNQYFKVNSPGHKLLTNHICLLCWLSFSLLFLC